jgi:hypothetical protein
MAAKFPVYPDFLTYTVSTRDYNYSRMVQDAWGEDWTKRDVVYEFSGGYSKVSTDWGNTGFYNGGAS